MIAFQALLRTFCEVSSMRLFGNVNPINKRLFIVLLLGFSGGLPLALTSSTLQAWLTTANVNLTSIGLLSLIGLPYTFKFIWAPAMDYFSLSTMGMRRSWILLTQTSLVISLLLLAMVDPVKHITSLYMLAFAVAFFAASQDIAIDAYRTEVLTQHERGLGSAYYIFAYRVAMLVSGGLALITASFFGWKITYQCMAFIMVLMMIVTYCAPKTESEVSSTSLIQTVISSWRDLMTKEKISILLLFLVFYKFGDALALQLMTNFLLKGLGFSLVEIGVAYKLVSMIATILGAFIGGMYLTRWTLYRALLVFGLAQTFSNLMFVLLAITGKNFGLMAASIFIENFCGGLSTAALMAFIMSICNRQYAATQFAILSAVTVLGRVLLGPMAATMVTHLGWVSFYGWSFILCFPGILFLLLLKERVLRYATVPAN